jgi:hypothetical protein
MVSIRKSDLFYHWDRQPAEKIPMLSVSVTSRKSAFSPLGVVLNGHHDAWWAIFACGSHPTAS